MPALSRRSTINDDCDRLVEAAAKLAVLDDAQRERAIVALESIAASLKLIADARRNKSARRHK